jgi:hypothetical protein
MLGPWLTSGGRQIRFRSFMDFFRNLDGAIGSCAFSETPLRVNIFHVIACKHIRQTPTSNLKTRRTCWTPHLRKALR